MIPFHFSCTNLPLSRLGKWWVGLMPFPFFIELLGSSLRNARRSNITRSQWRQNDNCGNFRSVSLGRMWRRQARRAQSWSLLQSEMLSSCTVSRIFLPFSSSFFWRKPFWDFWDGDIDEQLEKERKKEIDWKERAREREREKKERKKMRNRG